MSGWLWDEKASPGHEGHERAWSSGALALGATERAVDAREARAAVTSAAGLYVVGALLTASAALLPHVGSPAGVIAVALDALLTAGALLLAANRRWGGLWLAFAADMWGVLVVAVLCASSGGPDSPFALIYLFAMGHAAAFQPRGRFLFVSGAGLAAFLAPLVYASHVSTTFGAIASVGIVLALLTSAVVHSTLDSMREQRRRLEILIAATSKLDSSLDPAETLSTIAQMAVPAFAAVCVIEVVDEGGSLHAVVAGAADPVLAAEVERMRLDRSLDAACTQRILEAGYVPAAVLPMVARGRTHGAISYWQPMGEARLEKGLLAVLEDLTGRAAMAFDNARLYAERALAARTLRHSLMPAVLPVVAGLELASFFRPMWAGDEVGGDFYDAFGDRESCWLVVGDVCGKGAEAAAVTGFLRHTVAAYAREESSPVRVLAHVNRAMLEQDFEGCFATAVLAHLRFRGPRVDLTVSLAGHPAALLARADGRVSELGGRGSLLGVLADPIIDQTATVLAPGDALVLYTDGLVEAHAPEQVVTVQAMVEQLERLPPGSAQGAIEALIGLIDLGTRVRDDIAVLVARVNRDEEGSGDAAATVSDPR